MTRPGPISASGEMCTPPTIWETPRNKPDGTISKWREIWLELTLLNSPNRDTMMLNRIENYRGDQTSSCVILEDLTSSLPEPTCYSPPETEYLVKLIVEDNAKFKGEG
jgi:hypothetical protein